MKRTVLTTGTATHSHTESDVTSLTADLAARAPLASPAFTGTPTGITKAHVGLGSVDNTADTAKPVSTAQQAAINAVAADGSGWGLIYTIDPLLAQSLTASAVANRAHFLRVIGGGTITKIGFEVGTSSGNIDIGIYRANGAGRATGTLPKLVSTGSTACPAAGYREVSLGASYTVNPGDWFAIAVDNTTATFRTAHTAAADTNLVLGRQFYLNTSFPLPSTAASTSGGIARAYCLVGVA